MSGSLGSGAVEYHPDRPILHWGMSAQQLEDAERAARLRQAEFKISDKVQT